MTATAHFNDFATFDYWDNFEIGGKFGNKFTNELSGSTYDDEEYLNFDNVEIYDSEKYFSDDFPILNDHEDESDKDKLEIKPTQPPKKEKATKPSRDKRPSFKKKRPKPKRGKKKFRRKEGMMTNRMMAGFNNLMEFLSRPGRNLRNGIEQVMRNLRR